MAAAGTRLNYTIGIICALPLERTAVESMLDEHHDQLPAVPGDNNTYSFGRIGAHHVVVASLGSGSYGTVSAAEVAGDMRHTFPAVKWGFMVGIAGAAPRPYVKGGDIRLGDIVVGCVNGVPSVINYHLGKETSTGFDIRSELAEPPGAIQRAVSALQSQHQREGPTYLKHLQMMLQRYPRFNRPQIAEDYYNRPEAPDVLFASNAVHNPDSGDCSSCRQTDDAVLTRTPRFLREPPAGLEDAKFIRFLQDGLADYPRLHYGTIASGDSLMKSGTERDAVVQRVKAQRKADVLCFEMEAAGMVKSWPCLVVRGICDYADAHKNDAWQNFAAATAAAYTKDLLVRIPSEAVEQAPPASSVIGNTGGAQTYQSNARLSSSPPAVNARSDSQYNFSQYGGSNNKQFHADTMTFGGNIY